MNYGKSGKLSESSTGALKQGLKKGGGAAKGKSPPPDRGEKPKGKRK